MQFYSLSYFFFQKIQNDMMSQIDVHVYVHVCKGFYGFHVGYGCGVNYRKILRVNNMLYYFLGCLCSIFS